jgi:predicted hydrolase (HD superfamily)
MTTKEIREEVKTVIIEKGFANVTNRDVIEIQKKLGLPTSEKVCTALRYFTYSKQTANYR